MDFEKVGEVTLTKPTMIIAVSTSLPQYKALYSQARELGEYMLKNLNFETVATLHSSAFPPEVIVRGDGVSTLPQCTFYATRGKENLLLFTGDTSPMDDQYEFARRILDFAKESGVEELYSIGARWAENPIPPEQDPEALGFATDSEGVEKLKKNQVKVMTDEPAPFFASIIVPLASEYGIRGYKLSVDHGEPSPHVRSVAKLLGALSSMAGFEISLDELRAQFKPASAQRQVSDETIYH